MRKYRYLVFVSSTFSINTKFSISKLIFSLHFDLNKSWHCRKSKHLPLYFVLPWTLYFISLYKQIRIIIIAVKTQACFSISGFIFIKLKLRLTIDFTDFTGSFSKNNETTIFIFCMLRIAVIDSKDYHVVSKFIP